MPINETYLALVGFSGKAELTTGADPIRKEALEIAGHVHKVTDEGELAQATDALRVVGDIIKAVGEVRKTLTRQIDELKKEAMRLEESYLEPLRKEHGRIQGMMNHFLIKQREQERLAEEAATRERQKAIQAQHEAERLAREAEAAKQRALDAEKAGNKATAWALLKRAEEAESLALSQALAAEDASLEVAPVETMKVSGLSVRERINYRVRNWQGCLQAVPQFWKWDKEKEVLKLHRRDILDFINEENSPRIKYDEKTKLPIIAGLEIFREAKGHTR